MEENFNEEQTPSVRITQLPVYATITMEEYEKLKDQRRKLRKLDENVKSHIAITKQLLEYANVNKEKFKREICYLESLLNLAALIVSSVK